MQYGQLYPSDSWASCLLRDALLETIIADNVRG